jgi:enoyl-CoA hydratase/carnithine racemase
MLLEANRWTGKEALEDGIVDAVAEPEEMLNVALEMGANWAPKAKMGYVHSLNFDFIRMIKLYVDGQVLIAVNIGSMPCFVRSFGETRSRSFRGLVMFMVV